MGFQKNTIEDCIEIARQRKGECLSNEYKGALTKLKWKCEHGHEWEATPSKIKYGQWCPHCSRNRSNKKLKI